MGNSVLKGSNDMSEKPVTNSVGTPLENPLHEQFCLYYSKTLNATQSYLSARVAVDNRTIGYDSARAIASKLLTNINIRMRLSELTDHTAQSLQISKSEIIEDIKHELDADPFDIYNWDNDNLVLKRLDEIPLHVRQTIKSIKKKENGEIEVTFYDRQKAREQLMKYLGMLNDSATVNINMNLGETLEQAHQRVLKKNNLRTK